MERIEAEPAGLLRLALSLCTILLTRSSKTCTNFNRGRRSLAAFVVASRHARLFVNAARGSIVTLQEVVQQTA